MWLLSWLYAPLFFLGFLGAAIAIVSSGASAALLVPLLGLAILVSFAAERLAPFEPGWNRAHGDVARDVAHALVNEISNITAVAALPLLAGLLPGPGWWPHSWPQAAQLAVAVLVADGGITLAHFASHRIPMLWRLHAVHHSVRRLYGLNGLMKHPLHQAVELVAGTTPLLLLGMPQNVAALLAFAVAIQLLLQHSNVDLRVGPLIRVWAVAPTHRFHHLASTTSGDVNFGLFTSLWDHMLGTSVSGPDAPRAGMLGVAGRPDYPDRYLAQLREPFLDQVSTTPGAT